MMIEHLDSEKVRTFEKLSYGAVHPTNFAYPLQIYHYMIETVSSW